MKVVRKICMIVLIYAIKNLSRSLKDIRIKTSKRIIEEEFLKIKERVIEKI